MTVIQFEQVVDDLLVTGKILNCLFVRHLAVKSGVYPRNSRRLHTELKGSIIANGLKYAALRTFQIAESAAKIFAVRGEG